MPRRVYRTAPASDEGGQYGCSPLLFAGLYISEIKGSVHRRMMIFGLRVSIYLIDIENINMILN